MTTRDQFLIELSRMDREALAAVVAKIMSAHGGELFQPGIMSNPPYTNRLNVKSCEH